MYCKHNTTVKGQKVPPPSLTLVNINSSSTSKATPYALLHTAYTRGGRAFSCFHVCVKESCLS